MFKRRGTSPPQDEPQTARPSDQPPPGRYFISHGSPDEAGRAALLGCLPAHIEPLIFHNVTLPPTQAVSDKLIGAICSCDGMIYLDTAASLGRFWPHFERRYALRRKIPVYAFDPTSGSFRLDQSEVANLIAPFWNDGIARDRDRALRILEWLQGNRSVYASPIGGSSAGYTTTDDPASFKRKFDVLGGTVVVFVSNEALSRPWPFVDNEFLSGLDARKIERFISCSEVVWLGKPDFDLARKPYNAFSTGEPADVLLRRMIGRTVAEDRVLAVDLSDDELHWHRVDDLLAHIEYWAHRQETLPFNARTRQEKKQDLEDAKREIDLYALKKNPRLL